MAFCQQGHHSGVGVWVWRAEWCGCQGYVAAPLVPRAGCGGRVLWLLVCVAAVVVAVAVVVVGVRLLLLWLVLWLWLPAVVAMCTRVGASGGAFATGGVHPRARVRCGVR